MKSTLLVGALLTAITTTGAFAQAIKLADVAELSGGGATVGTNWKNGIDLAIEEINAKGGVLGRKLEVSHADSQSNPGVARAQVQKALDAEPYVLLGPGYSGSVKVTAPLAAEAGIAQIMGGEAAELTQAGNTVAVIGAGGVGKAIAFALASLDVTDIRIFDSEPERAGKLVALLAAQGGARMASSVEDALNGATGLVNGTPVGMLPNRGMPVPAALLQEKLWVADAVYSPLITPLLAAAQAKGARIMTGRELAIYQAADAFELFTGLAPSTEIMGEAFDDVMAARNSAYHAA